ncbi:FtsK/SpoIIIE domain-containing protein [Specibacter sp. NPDC057265]|uniref:FtsK/SpoIIIE domain-containing protein n=1 Tax=Specibacter sp. NPDC057265 TaxID=3346075 RepID=UPI0036402920
MLLELTVVAGIHPAAGGGPVSELSVTWPAETAVADCSGTSLEAALAPHWPGCSFTVAGEPLGLFHAGQLPLVNGAVVVAWPPAGNLNLPGAAGDGPPAGRGVPGSEALGAAAVLAVAAGPGAGALFALHRGEYSIGRGNCRIQIADPALSRHHGTLVVSEEAVLLSAAGGSTGFTIRGAGSAPTAAATALHGRMKIVEGMAIGCGSSVLELRFPASPAAGRQTAPGQLLSAAALEPLMVPQAAGSASSRWAMVLAGTLPLILGLVLALTLGSWMFLAFSAVGAVTMVGPVISGTTRRKVFRKAVTAAVIQDVSRQSKTFPDAATLVFASHGAVPPPPRLPPADIAGAVALRLGSSPRRAALVVSPRDPGFTPPRVAMLPFCAALTSTPLVVSGAANAVASLVRFILLQLDAAAMPVVVLGPAELLPLSARFLPRTSLSTTAAAALRELQHLDSAAAPRGGAPCILLCLQVPVPPWVPDFEKLRVVHFADEPGGAIHIAAAGNRMMGSAAAHEFVPDGVPAAVFDGCARARSRQEATAHWGAPASAGAGGMFAPAAPLGPCTLPAPELCTPEAVMRQWQQSLGGPLRPVPLGQTGRGWAMLDLDHDGPHLLVAGTTGSGKSEFLRTLVGGLAAAHSPADLHFVFIDFKGGAGLGVLGKLPHASSLITDLGGHGVERTLASLRAELRTRETALAQAEAADAAQYRALARLAAPNNPARHPMGHLVVVIDEFRVLVDQFPDALAELMRLAAVGRSLGIHLVMATQRPQGAINADIRANVTSSICLRVQSGFDSSDVIGSSVAATIGVDDPGRAFISRAGAAPEEFHSATLALPPDRGKQLPVIQETVQHLNTPRPTASCGGNRPPGRASDVDGVAELMHRGWRLLQDNTEPRPPAAPAVVAPELPAKLAAMPGARGSSTEGVFAALVDAPEQQALHELWWRPELHSHVACFGTAAQSSAVVALLAGQLLAANAAAPAGARILLYLLDGDGSLAPWHANPCVGSHLLPSQLRTAAHLLTRLTEGAETSGRTIVLCVTNWARWLAGLRASPWHGAEETMGELIRFGSSNFTVVVGGGRELLGSTFLPAMPNRVYIPHGSSSESTLLWPTLPRFAPLPGRAAVCGPFDPAGSNGNGLHVAQFAPASKPTPAQREAWEIGGGCAAGTVLQVVPLPSALAVEELAAARPAVSAPTSPLLTLGLGGDGRDAIGVALPPGAVLPVVGVPGSGKSTFLQVLAKFNGGLYVRAGQALPSGALPGGSLWLDDAAQLTAAHCAALGIWLAQGGRLVAAFNYPGPELSALPLEWGLRSAQQGVVLAPQRAGDADLFGVRLQTMGGEPPGRAVLVERGCSSWFQFPQDLRR